MISKIFRSGTIVLLTVLAGCAGEAAGADFPNSYRSAEGLAKAVLSALAAEDRQTLESLRVTEEEYTRYFWEQLPESNDLPLEYVWMLNERNSQRSLEKALAAIGGTEFDLIALRTDEEVENYQGFNLHFGARMIVRRTDDGEVGELPLLDVLVERDGRWKLLNYDLD